MSTITQNNQITTIISRQRNKWAFVKSNSTIKGELHDDPIFLIQQFYISENKQRYEETQFALQKNVENKSIDTIYLLNERKYSDKELGCSSSKIKQVIIHKRMMVSHILNFVESFHLKGYIVFSNSDIFLDDTIYNVKYSGIHQYRKLYSQLRIEYQTGVDFNKFKLFDDGCDGYIQSWSTIPGWNPLKCDSADTWIYHSNFNIPREDRYIFERYIGWSAIDQVIPMMFFERGFEIANEPYFIKTFHCHENNYRIQSATTDKRYFDDYLLCFPHVTH